MRIGVSKLGSSGDGCHARNETGEHPRRGRAGGSGITPPCLHQQEIHCRNRWRTWYYPGFYLWSQKPEADCTTDWKRKIAIVKNNLVSFKY
ncbi:MAG: hypothetical protein OXD44_03925 [Gammaproteobacteria bacterium]|nr:hypothetical protein [Gammaproteobacteria bacterium]